MGTALTCRTIAVCEAEKQSWKVVDGTAGISGCCEERVRSSLWVVMSFRDSVASVLRSRTANAFLVDLRQLFRGSCQ